MNTQPLSKNGKRSRGRSGKVLSEINVTPFVDVVLVLLIIFMVTAPLLSQGLNVQLPQEQIEAMDGDKEDVAVSIDEQGRIFLQDETEPYTLESLEEKIPHVYERRQKKNLIVRADQRVPYGTVVAVMAVAKRYGVEGIGLVTDPTQKETKKNEKRK